MKIKEIRKTAEDIAPAGMFAEGRGTDSPVERMLRYGAKVLASDELVAMVLGPGGPVSALAISRQILAGDTDLVGLAGISPLCLCRYHGMGLARAARLAAAIELGCRCQTSVRRSGLKVTNPRDLLPVLAREFRGLDREHFLALYLDARHRVLAVETVSIGSLNASLVHPREVFKPAIALGVAALIVAHNHPSGCVQPSVDDLDLTERLARCGRLLGIELLDHLVYGNNRLTSIREYGWPGAERLPVRPEK